MPLPGSGLIKLSDIAAEFSNPAPYTLREFLGAGGAPSSGTLQMSHFYGRSAADYVPNPVNWDNMSSATTSFFGNSQVVSGISEPITIVVSISNLLADNTNSNSTLDVSIAGTAYTAWQYGVASYARSIANNNTVFFAAYLGVANAAADASISYTVSVLNQSNGNAVLDTFNVSLFYNTD